MENRRLVAPSEQGLGHVREGHLAAPFWLEPALLLWVVDRLPTPPVDLAHLGGGPNRATTRVTGKRTPVKP